MNMNNSLAVVIISILIAFIHENLAIIGNKGVSESQLQVNPLITYSREFLFAL